MNADQEPFPPAAGTVCVNSSGKAGTGSGRADMLLNEKYVGYEARVTSFESRWGPWGFCDGRSPQKRSPSPYEGDCSISRTDDDEEDEDYYDDDEDEDEDDEDEDVEEEEEEDVKTEIPDSPRNAADGALERDRRVGAGLMNLGNTCYLNAVLQCLVHTDPLQQGLSMFKHNIIHCFTGNFCLICALREQLRCSFSRFNEIAPSRIVANLKYFSPDFVRYQQEDAHEFLQCLLNKLERYPVRSSDPFSITQSDNLVKQVFGGCLVSRLRCSKCNHISSRPEDLIDFSLEIDDVNTLEGALDSFTKPEKIEDIRLTCERCNENASMEKQFLVDKAPIVASFHLKRFKNDGTTVEKILKHIEYPLSLNLHPYTVGHPEHNAGLIYDLYAVIVHSGYSSNGGHYFCFVRSSPSEWHEFDDSTVTRVCESHVLSQEAYILFYSKHETSWFFNGNEVQSLCQPIISPNSVLDNGNQSGESDYSTESLHKCDVQVNRHEEDSVETCQTSLSGPQHVNIELVENEGHGNFSDLLPNGEGDDKNAVSKDDSSFNFDMLLNAEEKENRRLVVDTDDSSPNFDMLKDESNNTSEELADKGSSLFSSDVRPNISTSQEHVDFTLAQICSTSVSNIADSSAFPSLGEASNLTNKNPIIPDEGPTKSPSSLVISSRTREDTKMEKRILRKRSAEKQVDDQYAKKQIFQNSNEDQHAHVHSRP